jgi:hypothetical protein
MLFPLSGNFKMRIFRNKFNFSELVRPSEFQSCRSRLAVAFFSGMALTAIFVPAVLFVCNLNHHESILPVPENTPGQYQPGIYPDNSPVIIRLTGLTYNLSGKVFIAG